jgi:hypothetical protein
MTDRKPGIPSSAVATARARLADLYRHGPRDPDEPEVLEAHRALNAALAEERATEIAAARPPLTDEQIRNVAALLWAGSGRTARHQLRTGQLPGVKRPEMPGRIAPAPPPLAPESELLFADEMERHYKLPQTTWRYWAANNMGPRSFLLGRRRVWRRSDVEKWLAEQEQRG